MRRIQLKIKFELLHTKNILESLDHFSTTHEAVKYNIKKIKL
jgi:hypothetical protein